jgi:regulator of replication initiation timing
MHIKIDTTIGNRVISEKLKAMLTDLRSNTEAILDSIDEIKAQAHSEGFEDYEIDLLIRSYLKESLSKDRLRYILYKKPRREAQKNLIDKVGPSPQIDYNNVPQIPDQIPDEVTQGQQTENLDNYKQHYALEDLRAQLDNVNSKNNDLAAQIKTLKEQLGAKTRNSPSNSIPAVQGNNSITKVVVSHLFKEILQLKGSKMIYANIIIDTTQNKYIRLEPFQ